MMKLEILIPTYNRDEFLLKNLKILKTIIMDNNLENQVALLISNNQSSDRTHELVQNFKEENADLTIKYYLQKENIGLQKNALFILEKAQSGHIMYLGDDDYITSEYIIEVLMLIDENKDLGVIIPNYVPVSINGDILGPPREKVGITKKYKPGFSSVLKNSWKGHQLSGLVLFRSGLLKSYISNDVNNIYPFIYFVSIIALKSQSVVIKSNPVRVTQPIKAKDWGYGKDGLVYEIFNNYNCLPINSVKIAILQLWLLRAQGWRLWMYIKKSKNEFSTAFYHIWLKSKGKFLFKIGFPVLAFYQMIRRNI